MLPALQARRDALRRHGLLHVGRRGREADPRRPLRHGRRGSGGALAFLKRLRGKRQGQAASGRRAADEDAAAPAQASCASSPAPPRTCAPISSPCNTGWRDPTTTSPTWSASWSTATPTARAAAARRVKVGAAGRISRCRRLPPAHEGPHRRDAPSAAAPAGRQAARSACWLMRSYLLAGNTAHYDGVIAALEARGLDVDPRLRQRARSRARRSSASSCRTAARGRRGGLADRLLAGRRPRLQRRAGGRGHAGRARRALPRRAPGRIPDAGAVGRIAIAACCRSRPP